MWWEGCYSRFFLWYMLTSLIIMETHDHDHNDEEDFFFAMQMANGVAVSCVIKAAVELEVFDTISKAGPNVYVLSDMHQIM
ncbi:hypothetical protein Scep_025202 [Stephania cephalantha]|uniref:Uncharacterized protein n=1 Tax=Stephania cephalantha TaxID=152367 RepID=A0AAP0HM46_9MAGN